MIERAKNIWAALKFALGRECRAPIELDEAGERMLKAHLDSMAQANIEISADLVQMSRAGVASRQRLQKMLDDPAVGIDEIVRRERAENWKRRACEGRKSVRIKVFSLALFAIALLCLGPQSWNAFSLVLFLGWILLLAAELNGFIDSAEFAEMDRQSLIALQAGDSQKSEAILRNYIDTGMARMDMNLVDIIDSFAQDETNYESRK